MNAISHKQSIFIDAPIETVWRKLTTADTVLAYFHYSILRVAGGELRPGAEILYEYEGEPHIVGSVTEFVPNETFSHTFRFPEMDDAQSLVRWILTQEGSGTRLELVHERLVEGSKTAVGVASANGWPMIVKRLQTEIQQEAYIELPVS